MVLAGGGSEAATTSKPDDVARRRMRLAAWLGVAVLCVTAYWDLVAWDPKVGVRRPTEGLEAVFFEPSGTSPLLILLLTGFFIWLRANRLAIAFQSGGRPVAGSTLLAAAVGVAAWAHYVGAPDLLIPSLQLLLLGGGTLLGGTRALAILRLPVLFLCLALPIPPVLLNSIIFPLQLFTANVSQDILELLGFQSMTLGDMVMTPWGNFHVIESCAGIRGVLSLVMASIVYSEIFHRSFRRALLLFAAAPIVGIVLNVARVQSIIFSPYAGVYAVHTAQGLVMTIVGVLTLAGIDRIAEAWRRDPGPRGRPWIQLTRTPLPPRLVVVAAVLAGVAVLPVLVPEWGPAAGADQPSVRSLPHQLDGWTSNGIAVDSAFLGSVAFSDRIQRRFTRGDEAVDVLVGEDDRLNRRGSIYSAKTAYPGSAWDLVESSPIELDGVHAELLRFRSRDGERLVVHWREGVAGMARETWRSVLGLDRSPWRRARPAVVWRLGTDIGASAESARARLVALANGLHAAWTSPRPRAEG